MDKKTVLQGTYIEVEHPDYHHQHNQQSCWPEESGEGVILEEVEHPALGGVEGAHVGRDHSQVCHLHYGDEDGDVEGGHVGGDHHQVCDLCLHYQLMIIQGVFFNWYPPKKLKYGKPRLGESTLT